MKTGWETGLLSWPNGLQRDVHTDELCHQAAGIRARDLRPVTAQSWGWYFLLPTGEAINVTCEASNFLK